ncbi:MAG TPA: restriction endonuclease subunit S [Abditibacteriaceae bacterium]|jgi:type I restriction enzyme S subunit
MKYPAYPNYKPSGVEWLGDVPDHWEVIETKFGYSIQLGKMLQPEPASTADIEVPYLKAQHVQWETVRVSDLPTMWASKGDFSKYEVRAGDLLVCEGGDVGRAGMLLSLPENCIIQNALHRVRPKAKGNPKFLMYVLKHAAAQGWFEILCSKSTIAHFTGEKFGALKTVQPPLSEQRAIADFLDRETAKIDTLITKKRALIKKLKEKRTALISRIVTRGLPPDAARAAGLNPGPKLKPSGIEWLGDMPEHWDVVPLRYQFLNLDFKRIPLAGEDRATLEKIYPYYGASGIIDKVDNYLFDEPLVLVAEDGANLLSRSTPLAFLATGKYWVNNHAHILKPRNGDIRYWEKILQTHDYTPLVTGAAQPKLTSDRLRGIRLPKPPVEEQRAIADYLDRETAKLDRMREKVEAAIGKLQEYRMALITAAVTGKIDVRGETK